MRNETFRNFPWHIVLAFIYPPLNNTVMNKAVEWLASSDPASRAFAVLAGVTISAALLVATCRFVIRRPTHWLGVLMGVVGFWFYYVYHPEESVVILLGSIMRDLASIVNMLVIVLVPVVIGVFGNRLAAVRGNPSSSS
jgi:hypothetical protein